MQKIIFRRDKSFSKVNNITLFEDEKNADYLEILIPQIYNDIDISTCNIRLIYITPDNYEDSFLIDEYKQENLYKDNIVYLINIDERFTSVVGEIQIYLTFSKTDEKDIIFKSDVARIFIKEHPSGDNDLTERELQIIDQVVLISNEALQVAENKQDKLIAGNNITIKDNVISATGGGTGGGTTNYEDLEKIPTINEVKIKGNLTSEDLKLQPKGDYATINEMVEYIEEHKEDLKGENGLDGKNGTDGIGIIEATINTDGELIIVYSDGNNANLGKVVGKDGVNGTDGIDGKNGLDGEDGVGISKTEINDDGELIIHYSNGDFVKLGVVIGTNGKDGTDGQDGYSPTAIVIQTETGATITITDKNGTTEASVINGKDGKDGEVGKDGYTPVKGTDYFTEDDIKEIAKDVEVGLIYDENTHTLSLGNVNENLLLLSETLSKVVEVE